MFSEIYRYPLIMEIDLLFGITGYRIWCYKLKETLNSTNFFHINLKLETGSNSFRLWKVI